MKKTKLITAALVCSMLCACGGGGTNGTSGDNAVPFFSGNAADKTAVTEDLSEYYKPLEGDLPSYFEYTYDSTTPEHFAVADDGRMVMTRIRVMPSGNIRSEFFEYSLDGSSKKVFTYDYYPDAIAFMGDELYISETWGAKTVISKLDTETGKKEEYVTLPIKYCFVLQGNKDELYIYGDDHSKDDMKCGYPNFYLNGKSIYRIYNGEAELLPVDFPTTVCAKKAGGAVIAACDDNGYYIVEYKDRNLGEKMYTDDPNCILGIADVDGTHIIFSSQGANWTYSLFAADLRDMCMAELIPDKSINSAIYSAGGYCFYEPAFVVSLEDSLKDEMTENTHIIERIKFSEYFKDNPPISLMCSYFTNDKPFGCGHPIKASSPSNEEIALKILSQDKDYDMCCLNTRDDISYAIKSKGSFYPLNGVEGVSEFLDKCFPAVKAACTDENGNIWALPVKADGLFIISNYKDADISAMDLSDYVDFIDSLTDEQLKRASFSGYICSEIMLEDYVIHHDSFDTPEFRRAAQKLKNSRYLNMTNDHAYSSIPYDMDIEEVILSIGFYEKYLLGAGNILSCEGLKTCGMPCVDGGDVFMPNLTLITVNPSSNRLDYILGYISDLAKYESEQMDKWLLNDYEYYSNILSPEVKAGLMSMYADPDMVIHFTYPSELYWDRFKSYLAGNISLDDFIKETDRTIRAYMNE